MFVAGPVGPEPTELNLEDSANRQSRGEKTGRYSWFRRSPRHSSISERRQISLKEAILSSRSPLSWYHVPDRAIEEVRGIFVLGVLATLLVLIVEPGLQVQSRLPSEVLLLLEVLILYWGSYAFTMAIGVSYDILGVTVGRMAAWIGHSLFFYSLLATSVIAFLAVTNALPFGFKIQLLRPFGPALFFTILLLYFAGGLPRFIRYLCKQPRKLPSRGRILTEVVFVLLGVPLIVIP